MDSILIYDSDPVLLDALRKSLEEHYQVYCCGNRQDFLALAAEMQPMVMVVDLSFFGEDTISVLQSLYMSGYRTHIVASGNYCSTYLSDRLSQLQVHSFMTRPCSANALLHGVMDATLLKTNINRDQRRYINDLLLNLGFRMDLHGYRYLPDALIYVMEHPDCVLTSQLYPDIARPYHSTGEEAEKAIRDSICWAWRHRDPRIWKRYFPEGVHRDKSVSNGVFLKRIAYAISDYMDYVQLKTGTDE